MCPSPFRSALGACQRTRTTAPQRCRCIPAGKADGARKTHTVIVRIAQLCMLHGALNSVLCQNARRMPLSPPDFSSRWFLKHAGREKVNPRRCMLNRTWLRSSVCWVSLPFTDTILTVCACETNLRKFFHYCRR